MKMNLNGFLFVVLPLLSGSSKALAESKFIFDVTGRAGTFKTSVAAGQTAPTMTQTGLGLTLAYALTNWFSLGIDSDYQSLNQYSDPTAAVGNRHGVRMILASPMVCFQSMSWMFKADYQMGGDYKLKSLAVGANDNLKFSDPTGSRIEIAWRPSLATMLGLYFETVKYAETNFSITQADAGQKLSTQAMGLALSYRLVGM